MHVERRYFFERVRAEIFGGRLRAKQVEGLNAVLDGWRKRGGGGEPEALTQSLAYVLATAFHETAGTMQPMRETLARTDAAAIARLEKAYASGRLGSVRTPYWRPDAEGKSWLGRGLVQLTHRRNYEAMSELTGVDLVSDPSRAMEMEVSVTILIEGMRAGSFTGMRLGDYFGPRRDDWLGARRIINGTDRAELVAGYGRAFCRALAGV
ncbi:glycoside hydrolase family 19 protein [Rhizobium sp. LCM 4573]|uniref:glycoside hydrolase family 19 protein n=1 Tax=Rhizobium sp. LCM 4573 TaxID=1848291 RepID=UPI0008D8DA2A|nr:glycoside hydrolase family 19 protein [Rhizobium sp. LCM 4573]OHV75637.1 hypothetical protein LCM4573_15980 [Rhizobium sp. LCM 4573]